MSRRISASVTEPPDSGASPTPPEPKSSGIFATAAPYYRLTTLTVNVSVERLVALGVSVPAAAYTFSLSFSTS